MKKKNIIIIIALVIFVLMLIPIPIKLKDGGSVEYKAILYKYTKIHRLSEKSSTGYEDGWELNILGIQVGGKINTYVEARRNNNSVELEVKDSSITPEGAVFIIKNNTEEEYSYGDPYTIEKFENGYWKEIDTITNEPLSWNSITYNLKVNEKRELNIKWSLGYGELKSGKYRLVKHDLRKSVSFESRAYSISAEFSIK